MFLAAAQPPGPPTLSGWHCAAHQADWQVSQGTSAWRRGVVRTRWALLTPPHPPPPEARCTLARALSLFTYWPSLLMLNGSLLLTE